MTDDEQMPPDAAADGTNGASAEAPAEPAAAAAKVRGRPFQKGQSGNPGGRPRMSDDVRQALTIGASAGAVSLAKIAADRKDPRCVAATVAIWDRYFGKPLTSLVGADGAPLFPGATTGDDPIAVLLGQIGARRTAAPAADASPPPEAGNAAPSAGSDATRVPPS